MAQRPQTRGAPASAPIDAGAARNQDAGGIFADQQDATDLAPRDFADGDATGFLENMRAGFDSTRRSGLMVSGFRSKSTAYAPIMDALNQGKASSDHLTNPWEGAARGGGGNRIRPRAGVLGIDFSGGWAGVTPEEQEQTVWAEIGRRRAQDPGFLPGIPKSRDELNAKVDEADKKALAEDDDIAKRATIWGTAGGFVGGVGASFRDPINVLTLPLGAGTAKTILGAAVREGALNAAIGATSQPAIADRNRELGREYGLDEMVTSTLYAGVGGAVLGGGAKGAAKGAKMLGTRIGQAKVARITEHAESRSRDVDAAGNVITSSAGARGRMQVMDGTNLDPGYGVKPAKDNSLAERARVGRDYIGAMMREYKNDPRKAWAAYNWGPGNLNKAIRDHGAAWLDHAPAETRKYVRENVQALGREFGYGANLVGGSDPDAVFPPASADQVSAAITLEGLDELGRTSPLPANAANDARHLETLQTHLDALEEGAPAPATARAEPIELKRPTAATLDSYDPRELVVDAQRFQFKSNGDDAGVTDRLAGVKEWSPILSGKAVVWVDDAGKPHVADGHQRVGLARRLLGENPAGDIRIDAVTLRAEDGITAEMARTWAALKNVAEGSGSPIDAAKILRTTGDNTPLPLPPKSALVRDARSLAALSDDAFGMVVNELVPPDFAAMVGRLAPGAPELHAAYLQLLHRLAPANHAQADSIIRQAIAAGATRETQLGLFGEEIVSRSLYLERARVLDNALRRLKNDKRVFRTLIESRADIEKAGNALASDANVQKVENNAQALEILARLAHRTGPVSDALGRAAAELGAGRPARAAVDRFIAELDELDLSELARGVERSPSDGAVPGGDGREGGATGEDVGMDRGAAGQDGGSDRAADAGGADDGLGEPIGFDLLGDPIYAPRPDELGDVDGPAVLEATADEAQEGLQLDAFGDPHAGPGAKMQTELLEHDVRAIAEMDRQGAQERPGAPIGAAGDQLTRDTVTAPQRGLDLDTLLSNAATNQRELAGASEAIAAELGLEFKNPGPKGAERAREKVEHELAGDPSGMLDLARGAFIVDTAEQGQAIADRLLAKFAIYDKGWKRTGSGYFDRKLIVQFANGGTAEVQIVPRPIWDYRKAGGHKLYTEARAPGIPEARANELNDQMAAAYDEALAASSFDQSAGSGTSGNSSENAATSSGTPSDRALPTTPGADRQALSLPDQAKPAAGPEADDTTATGLSSSSNNRTLDIENSPRADLGTTGENVNTPVTWNAADTQAAIAAHNQKIEERRPSSQDSAAGDTNGSGPRSDDGSAGRSSTDGGTETGTQPESRGDSARTPAGDETTSAGFPAQRTNEPIITPPTKRVAENDGLGLDDGGNGVNPRIRVDQAELVQLGAKSPLRPNFEQSDVDGLALFDQVRSPELFAIGERIDDGKAVAELRTADDVLAELDAHDAAIKAIEECMI